jgi:hypothetical protein
MSEDLYGYLVIGSELTDASRMVAVVHAFVFTRSVATRNDDEM